MRVVSFVLVLLAAAPSEWVSASAIRRSSSFVLPTRGSAHSLTLTTFLTDAADLHYAAVLSGHEPLDAAAIKNAAQQHVPSSGDDSVLQASTVAVSKAQKIKQPLGGLSANTSYDVYLVAEVPNSNGVYGPVLSVLGATTHPCSPTVGSVSVAAMNGSSSAVVTTVKLDSPGLVHIALVPSEQSETAVISADDVISRTAHGLDIAFATERRFRWDHLSAITTVGNLTPATDYDVLAVTEALGAGAVYSELVRLPRSVRTHALAPDIAAVMCEATKASSTSIDISFRLAVAADRNPHSTSNRVELSHYQIHYQVTSKDSMQNGTVETFKRGLIPAPTGGGVSEQAVLDVRYQHKIDGLHSDAEYEVLLFAETADSCGVIGKSAVVETCRTHAQAPHILSAAAVPMDGTIDSLQVIVELERAGNIHYLVIPQSSVGPVRHTFQQAGSFESLKRMFSDPVTTRSSVITMTKDSTKAIQSSIGGLLANTPYTVVLMPETIDSFGVFGRPYEKLLEVKTNSFASQVSVVSVKPSFGSLTSLDIRFSMTNPEDILILCMKSFETGNEECSEVGREQIQSVEQSSREPAFVFTATNLTEDSEYEVSMFAESSHRTGVQSNRSFGAVAKTFRRPPALVSARATPINARVDAIEIIVETNETAELHFVVVANDPEEVYAEVRNSSSLGSAPIAAEFIVDSAHRGSDTNGFGKKEVGSFDETRNTHRSHDALRVTERIVKREHALADKEWLNLVIDGLESNTTYTIHAVTETAGGKPSGVYGVPFCFYTQTHDIAPVIVKSTAQAVSNRTDSIVVTVNVTRPGIVHYHLTDTDFADPAVIRSGLISEVAVPHIVRGDFAIKFEDMGLEIKNGTNDTQPMDPMVFANNFTIVGLREDTTYHVSLTTESPGSNGVFGDFPAPILVKTHSPPPEFKDNSLQVAPLTGTSIALSIQFRLDNIAEVHFALFFRGIVRDRSSSFFEEQEDRRMQQQVADAGAHAKLMHDQNSTENAKDFFRAPRWPPPSSSFDIKQLTPQSLKDALFDQLKEGVWENGTITVSRDDVFRMKTIEKKIENLPPNAMFDVCLVPETAGSDGVFGSLVCQAVVTHADYTNQSIMYDEVDVEPVSGTTNAIRIQLTMSKLLEVSTDTHGNSPQSTRHIEDVTGRLPYFILIDGHEGRPDFSHNSFTPNHHRRQDHSISPFKSATPGRGHVVAAGVIDAIIFENETFVYAEKTVAGLQPNHRYFFFFAYESAGSDGVFTKVNPHKRRPNESSARPSEAQAIEVTTYEQAPRISRYEASPTFGNTSSISVKVDIGCVSQEQAIVHIVVASDGCPVPSTTMLASEPGEIATVETAQRVDMKLCELPLLYKRIEVNMMDHSEIQRNRHHHHNSALQVKTIEEAIVSPTTLQPNTTYHIFFATETYGSNGVISDIFKVTRVTTFPVAPRFEQLFVQPRKGSTTEFILVAQLDQPGEVHYMLGVAGNAELNVTSAYNISAKPLPGHRDCKLHDYGRDVVRLRRTIKVAHPGEVHVEVIDYLVAGTSYDVFTVAEGADDSGIYGEVFSFPAVSTFAAPAILLAHTAYPTSGRTDSLTVGFRAEDGIPCTVHVSVIASTLWPPTSRVAAGSDDFGNRLVVEERLITRTSIAVSPQAHSIDQWYEVNVSVPQPGANYTVFLVTETLDSEGVFGTVATHSSVRSHREPPLPLNISVRPTDARVDALTVDVVLDHDDGAHIHYAVLRHRQRFTRSAISMVGRIDVNASNFSSFVVDGLQGRTSYDVYLRLETYESGGVVGEWTPFPVTATTHGLPAELLESVECVRSCEDLGRHPCSHVANVCGECLDGFDGIAGSSNVACQRLEQEASRPTIKVSGVRINPRRQRLAPQLGVATDRAPAYEGVDVCPLRAGLLEPGRCVNDAPAAGADLCVRSSAAVA